MSIANVNFLFYFYLQSQKQNIDINRQAKFAATPSLALFVNLKNVVCKIGEDAEVLMSLYDPGESKFIRSVTLPCCCLSSPVSVRQMALEPPQILLSRRAVGGQLASLSPAAEPSAVLGPCDGRAWALGQHPPSSFLHARGYVNVEFLSCNVSRTWQLKIEVIVSRVVFIGFYVSRPTSSKHSCLNLAFSNFVCCQCYFWTFGLLLFLQHDWLEGSV